MVDQITPRTFNPSKFEPSTYAVEKGTSAVDYGESRAVESNLFLTQPRNCLYLLLSHDYCSSSRGLHYHKQNGGSARTFALLKT